MTPPDIPEPVRRLILEAIDSIAELEALILLRETPEQRWTPEAVAVRLYVPHVVAAHALDALSRRGFLDETTGGYSYHPSSSAMVEAVTALARTYATHLIAVTNLIHAKPSPSIQDFARAFRLRKDS